MSPRARLTFHHPVVHPKLNGIAIPPFPPPLNLHTAFHTSNSDDLAINWKLFPTHPSQKQIWDDYLAGGGLAQRAEVDIVGAFSLEPLVQEGDANGVGIRVDGHVVVVSTGTKVFRGLGMGAGGKEGRSLWWRGTMMNGGRAGIWTLGLIGASEGDLLSIHRLLLFLPLCFPIPATPPQKRLNRPRLSTDYRNSLLMIDDDTHEVLSVLSLPLPALLPPSLPVDQSTSHEDSQAHRDGIALAAQVDRITLGIFPGPYARSPHSHRTKEEEDECEESDRVDDSPRGLERREADGRYQMASTVPARDGSESTLKAGGTQVFVSAEKQQHGFDILDAVMGDMSPFPPPPPRAPSASAPIVPSLSSRPTSRTSTIFTHSFEATVSAYETALDVASARSSTFLSHWPSPPLLPSSLPHFPPSDLDLNSSNAVLLDFLAGPSVLHVTPVSQEAVERRGLVRAEVEEGWSWIDVFSLGLLRGGSGGWIGTRMLGGWDLSRLWRSTNEDVKESTTLRRKVSVLWVDGDGRGNRAFLRGGAGAVDRSRDV